MDIKGIEKYLYDVSNWVTSVLSILERDGLRSEDEKHLHTELIVFLNKLEDVVTNRPITVEEVSECQRTANEIFSFSQIVFDLGSERIKTHKRVPIGGHTLPPLPYPYNALEPYISEEIMRLHHDIHHKSYVDGLNKAEKMMEKSRATSNYDLLKHWEREAAFHGSGHYLNTIFWNVMKPNGGGLPSGGLASQIQKDFGSFNQFKEHFTEAAKKVEGVGWSLLVWSPRAQRLEILQTEKHQLMTQWDTIPLLVLDVWEHAYYLQYKTAKDKYINNWWNIVNWEEVENRFEVAYKLKWDSY
ncbi:superoxide dismutase [Bacillus sp. RD4P76]|uniref:superoxide dismutase n=1 Tax=Bacillus suaedaesalsae TaxID=2810349 RepID=A0ABS2DN43_9BACI|nr:superoxide dismutase [Bacillus suaedaesalsae]MBM6619926.1 superoxide dismutase [Bacillus suaedaesalsae]